MKKVSNVLIVAISILIATPSFLEAGFSSYVRSVVNAEHVGLFFKNNKRVVTWSAIGLSALCLGVVFYRYMYNNSIKNGSDKDSKSLKLGKNNDEVLPSFADEERRESLEVHESSSSEESAEGFPVEDFLEKGQEVVAKEKAPDNSTTEIFNSEVECISEGSGDTDSRYVKLDKNNDENVGSVRTEKKNKNLEESESFSDSDSDSEEIAEEKTTSIEDFFENDQGKKEEESGPCKNEAFIDWFDPKVIIKAIAEGGKKILIPRCSFNKDVAKALGNHGYFAKSKGVVKYRVLASVLKEKTQKLLNKKEKSKKYTIIDYDREKHWNAIKVILQQKNNIILGDKKHTESSKDLIFGDKWSEDDIDQYFHFHRDYRVKKVCVYNDIVVGFAVYDWRKESRILLDTLGVNNDPMFKRSGIGTKLINYGASQAVRNNIETFKIASLTRNHVARLAYLNAGFKNKLPDKIETYKKVLV